MADPWTEAAPGPDDLADVLNAIRRLLAEDEAGKAARAPRPDVIDEDAAEFLARRHGGNAALARNMARGAGDQGQPLRAVRGHAGRPAAEHRDAGTADASPALPEQAGITPLSGERRPVFSAPFIRPAAPRPVQGEGWPHAVERPRNDLVRTLTQTLAAVPEVADRSDEEEEAPVPPLRLDMADRVDAAEADASQVDVLEAAEQQMAADEMILAEQARFKAAVPMTQAELAAEFEAILEEDDFAEAFDWKVRAQPEAGMAQETMQDTVQDTVQDDLPIPAVAQAVAADPVEPDPMEPAMESAATEPAEDLPPPPRRRSFLRPSAWVFRTPESEAAPATPAEAAVPEVEAAPEQPAMACPVEDAPASHLSVVPVAAPDRVEELCDVSAEPCGKAIPAAEPEADASARPSDFQAALPEAALEGAERPAGGLGDEDDECIRDLLREMIREELSGELGERFSRNLRVLVRREIAAAIDAELSRL